MSTICFAQSHATYSTPERLDYRDCKLGWESFFKGDVSIKDLMATYGKKVVVVAPDRMETMPRILAKVQRDLPELHMGEDKAM